MKKLTELDVKLILDLKHAYYLLEQKREKNINRFILPIEDKMEKLRKKIDEVEFD